MWSYKDSRSCAGLLKHWLNLSLWTMYTQYRKQWGFSSTGLVPVLNFPFFHYSVLFLNFSRFSLWFLKFSKKEKHFFTKKLLLYCTFRYILVTPPIILCNGTVVNSVRPFWFVHKEQFKWLFFSLFLYLNILSIVYLISLDIDKFVS